jgi:hypothetical protein
MKRNDKTGSTPKAARSSVGVAEVTNKSVKPEAVELAEEDLDRVSGGVTYIAHEMSKPVE